MIKLNIVCWFGFHKFTNKDFCQRCGLLQEKVAGAALYKQPTGKTQFIEAVSGKERFDNAKTINDLLDNV